MTITNEIKSKVFAQYLGQICQTMTRQTQGEGKASIYLKGHLKEIDLGMQNDFIGLLLENETDACNHTNYNTDQAKLILTPLSQISDEDAIEFVKVTSKDDTFVKCENGVIFHKDSLFEDVFATNLNDNYNTCLPIKSFQFLQSKGYDLPQYLLGGKTLHECGLAIYESDNTVKP